MRTSVMYNNFFSPLAMNTFVAACVIALIHCSSGTLLIQGPSAPILMGEAINVECLLQDSKYNFSHVKFEYFADYMSDWAPVGEHYYWCKESPWERKKNMCVNRTNDQLILSIPASYVRNNKYRCATDGSIKSSPDLFSEPLSFTVHFLKKPQLTREGSSWAYRNRGFPESLLIRAGLDLAVNCSAESSEVPEISWQKEGSDWILSSSMLTLGSLDEMDEGQYTCSARHPTIPSLSKTRSFNITVLPELPPWDQTSDGQLVVILLIGAAACLVVTLTVTMFLWVRAKNSSTTTGSIDDHSQKKPIYKSSAESLPITCEDDDEPLV